jgi:hypothetical protein
VQKIFDVRWVFSSFVAIRAVVRDFPALYLHFSSSTDNNRKYKGLASKIQSWIILAEACMIKDALRCLKHLSLYMQGSNASIIDAKFYIEIACEKLLAMKDSNGHSLKKFIDSYDSDSCFKGICVTKGDADNEAFAVLRKRFFQTLHDNILQRFPPTALLTAASVLNQSQWPTDSLQRALFGDTEIAFLCKEFCIDSANAADVVVEYGMYRKTQSMGRKLAKFVILLKVLPISSADCERGFSQMNLHHTSLRNALEVETVRDLMMISINGPPRGQFSARRHVMTWLKSGRHGALDKSTGIPPKKKDICKSMLIFMPESS